MPNTSMTLPDKTRKQIEVLCDKLPGLNTMVSVIVISVESYFNQNVATFRERAEEQLFKAIGEIVCDVPDQYLAGIPLFTLSRAIKAGDSATVRNVLLELKDQTPNNLLRNLELAHAGWLDIVEGY